MDNKKITTETEYQATRGKIETIIAQGTALGSMEFLAPDRMDELTRLSDRVSDWEKEHYPLPNHSYPILIAEIRNKMEQQGMNQKQAAEALGIPESRLSELLRMRRGITLPVAKKLNRVLGIPADFILGCL